MKDALNRLLAWEGSTRSVALLRIACGAIIWAEYAAHHTLFHSHDPVRQAFGLLLVVSAGFMGAGLFTRTATALSALSLVIGYHWFGVHLGMKGPYVHAHSYLLMMAVVLLALLPAGRSLSVDRWLALRRQDRGGAKAPLEWGPLWPLALIRLQLALVYFWGAVDKTNVAFLSGSRLQQIFYAYFGSHEGMRIPLFDELLVLASIATVVFEYGVAFGMWFAPARKWLIPAGIVFHGTIYLTMPVGTFSVTSCVLYLAFVSPAVVHLGLERLLGVDSSRPGGPPGSGDGDEAVPSAHDLVDPVGGDVGGEAPGAAHDAG